jgi:hypothetical protein
VAHSAIDHPPLGHLLLLLFKSFKDESVSTHLLLPLFGTSKDANDGSFNDFKVAALVEGRKLSAMFWTVLGTSLKPHLPQPEPLVAMELKFTQ